MTVTIVGAQLGDEGKGGVVDLYGDTADVVARYQGGDNAGHTVVHDGEKYKLSLVPSGAVRGKIGVLGNGCVINPRTLFDEIEALQEKGLDPDVRVAERAHVILPFHRVLDGIEEDVKSEDDQEVGTTGRGIGPTYEDKAGRRGVRIGDLLDPDVLRDRLEYVVPQKRALIEDVYGADVSDLDDPDAFDVDALFEEFREIGERLAEQNMTVNASAFLTDAMADGETVMFEGAQGTIIDIDHGNYPYVTSSNPTAGGAAVGTGLSPNVIAEGEIIGIVKGYLTRVGSGPLPTELGGVEGDTPGYDKQGDGENEELATYIREEGGEYGTVTGRPRRVGWLDMPMLRHSARVNGFTGLAINHIDVLAGLDEVKIGHSYELDGEELLAMPPTTEEWGRCEATFKTFDGWDDVDWAAVAEEGYDAIPENARTYLEYISDELDAPIYAVGVGPGREETVVVETPTDAP
ncbi:adenylosuccinate synthase [Natrialba magadii ATCC 43099]|uniref:Adenylosuccinate synthetase n=1 Tax=Natrialba magadii (strain ATCC 43099 / DSM 3394 / CCM 3739 / CIP 104546 / IAM 13178 / JCM 8861 / NBRC 102185 / NCIMB 2190 / MS3) TaxID=547559 RepID=D3SRZ4_NATMM|nr:adenylosuccinate synthase [Natrialba magadii]ADD06768.1 adenylosuccinate synthase [Natrialba magadii ATCC 43099]ELY27796.1 adenylosuccinate synthetase [Natrialba magadii ATCC 43099]